MAVTAAGGPGSGSPAPEDPAGGGPDSQAAGRPDSQAAGRPTIPSASPARRRSLANRRRLAVVGVVIAGALAFLIVKGLTNATVYFETADQAVAHRSQLGSRQFRIEGTVEHDVRQVGGTTRFDIYANGTTVAVVDTGQPPQLFKPGIPVVLEGHWQGNVYAADQIMVKHTASYVEAHPSRVKSQLPTTGTTAP